MKRSKQNERIRDAERTIALLKKATMEQLISNGFAGLSVAPIIERAGVSRGALFHHYPTKDHLVAAAFGDLLLEFSNQLHLIGGNLRGEKITLQEFVVQVSDTMASDLFIGCMEIALGIRSEFGLSPLIEEAVAGWRRSLFDFWETTFELPGFDTEERATHWAMASNLLRGHAFSSTFGAGPEAKERLYRGFPKLILENAVIRPETTEVININQDSNHRKGE